METSKFGEFEGAEPPHKFQGGLGGRSPPQGPGPGPYGPINHKIDKKRLKTKQIRQICNNFSHRYRGSRYLAIPHRFNAFPDPKTPKIGEKTPNPLPLKKQGSLTRSKFFFQTQQIASPTVEEQTNAKTYIKKQQEWGLCRL